MNAEWTEDLSRFLATGHVAEELVGTIRGGIATELGIPKRKDAMARGRTATEPAYPHFR